MSSPRADIAPPSVGRRRFRVPEVVQTSAMDCGPAALASLLRGSGIAADYGRLREACQTDVDGTSIDTLEDVAVALGLDARQGLIPVADLLKPGALPALVVTKQPNGFTHFVVAWRRHGRFVQVMDPATGRRLVPVRQFRDDLYVHTMPLPVATWIDFARSPFALHALQGRLEALGIDPPAAAYRVSSASRTGDWQPLAALDAAARQVASLVEAGETSKGHTATRALDELVAAPHRVPTQFWTAMPGAHVGEVRVQGAVVIQVHGPHPTPPPASHDLRAVLTSPTPSPGAALRGLVGAEGPWRLSLVLLAAVLAGVGGVAELLLFRGLLDGAPAPAMLLTTLSGLLALEVAYTAMITAMGRRLEHRLRLRLVEKLPVLHDRYIQSRPMSDMAERSHNLFRVRLVPVFAGEAVRVLALLCATTVGLVCLDPATAPWAIAAAAISVGAPALSTPPLQERDLRLRTHRGALSRVVLDGFLGGVVLRAQRAQGALRHEHEELLGAWSESARRLHRTEAVAEGARLGIGYAACTLMLWHYLPRAGTPGRDLLFVFWAASLPLIGGELAALGRQWAPTRNLVLRILEPIATPATNAAAAEAVVDVTAGAARLDLHGVSVVAGGHTLLHDVNLHVPAGSHVAVVGSSGSGKSTLLGAILGWHRPASGEVRVGGVRVVDATVDAVRARIAWIDPAVRVWSGSLLENVRFGRTCCADTAAIVQATGVDQLASRLPDGPRERLGDAGGGLAESERQRVRIARALHRPDAGLVLLDEPLRGLDRDARRSVLSILRATWRHATLLCVTHEVSDAATFDRVVVVHHGRIVEDGPPALLAAMPGGRFAALLEAERTSRHAAGRDHWRRLWLDGAGTREMRT